MSALPANAAMAGALMRRSLNEVLRVPAAAIPGVLAPCIFMLGTTTVFGKLTLLPGFTTDSFLTFIVAVSLMQSASFAGAATGVNLARDIEQGWFDRLLVSRVPRAVLLGSIVASASVRALLPITFTLIVAIAFGAEIRGPGDVLLAIALASMFAALAATWATALALRFKTQSAAPLMQASVFMAVLFTTAYAPQHLLTGWLSDVARWNPVTKVVEGVRQGFVYGVSWGRTWPALLVIAGGAVLVGALALREVRRIGR